jgi:hypothetical protein
MVKSVQILNLSGLNHCELAIALDDNVAKVCDVTAGPHGDIFAVIVHCDSIPNFVGVVEFVFFGSVGDPANSVPMREALGSLNLNNCASFNEKHHSLQ